MAKERKPIWVCCNTCGSRSVTRDGLLRWDEETQHWEMSSELDNTDCDECGGETSLDEVPILSEDKIKESLKELGYTVFQGDDGYLLMCNGLQPAHIFEELADAYLWVYYHHADPAPKSEPESKPLKCVFLTEGEFAALRTVVEHHDVDQIDAKALEALKAKVLA